MLSRMEVTLSGFSPLPLEGALSRFPFSPVDGIAVLTDGATSVLTGALGGFLVSTGLLSFNTFDYLFAGAAVSLDGALEPSGCPFALLRIAVAWKMRNMKMK